jgi:hypothetical protein
MSQLESRAQNELSDVILGQRRIELSPSATATLAQFAFKSAILANFMNSKREPFFPPAVRERFRTSLDIPSSTQMWLSAFSGTFKSGVFVSYVSGPVKPNNYGIWNDFEFNVLTYSIGTLCFQVLSTRWADIRKSGQPLPNLTPNALWNEVAPRFWPANGLPTTWPPAKYLGDEAIEDFTNRWSAPLKFK